MATPTWSFSKVKDNYALTSWSTQSLNNAKLDESATQQANSKATRNPWEHNAQNLHLIRISPTEDPQEPNSVRMISKQLLDQVFLNRISHMREKCGDAILRIYCMSHRAIVHSNLFTIMLRKITSTLILTKTLGNECSLNHSKYI